MPRNIENVQRIEEVEVLTASDADGKELRIGDFVNLCLKVTGIRPITDPETGGPSHDILELGYVKPSGYVQHHDVAPSTWVRKAE